MVKFIVLALVIGFILILSFRSNANSKMAQQNILLGDKYLANNLKNEGVIATPSGLQYKKLINGESTIHPRASDKVRVHYHGTLINGAVFDSSVDRKQPSSFYLNQVIPGWTEGVQLMVVGDKTRFYIPARLAYGNRSAGAIQPGSVLIFDVELLAINP